MNLFAFFEQRNFLLLQFFSVIIEGKQPRETFNFRQFRNVHEGLFSRKFADAKLRENNTVKMEKKHSDVYCCRSDDDIPG